MTLQLLYMGFLGYCSGLVYITFRQRTDMVAGLHCQLLYITFLLLDTIF
jgi:hypothetical protein